MGTTICIYLPRYVGDAEDDFEEMVAALPITAAARSLSSTMKRPSGIWSTRCWTRWGYTVIGAADGAAGLKVLQSGARIDLLITDVGLPNGMNGRQVADAGRSLRPGLKVLFITGYARMQRWGTGT